jgi:tetratricopeptide (TPR) repeat protein
MRAKKLFYALIALQLSLFASMSHADDKTKKIEEAKREEAKKIFEDASIKYKTGDYPNALESFRRVYALTQEPSILFNIAQCQRLLDQPEEALKTFQLFIRDAPSNPLAENAKVRISELEAEIARQSVLGSIQVMTNPEGGKIFIDEKEIGAGPINVKNVAPGEHTILVNNRGYYPYELRFELQAGQAFSIRVPLREDTSSPGGRDLLQPKYFFMVAGGSGALGTAIGVTGLILASLENSKQTEQNKAVSDFYATNDSRIAITGDILFGAALVAGTSGLFLRLAEKKKASEPCQVK